MSGRYGMAMQTYGHILPGSHRLMHVEDLSKQAKERLKWFDWYEVHGRNARLTCRHFGLSPDVFYRWKRRFRPQDLSSLEDDTENRRPKKVRQPETDPRTLQRIKELREQYPRWGKKKLWKLLVREGILVSISTVGRTLSRLRQRGQLQEPAMVTARLAGARRRRKVKRPYAERKPWGFQPKYPGELVEIDTVYVYPVPGEVRYQFTATDTVSRHVARTAATSKASRSAKLLFDAMADRFPFPVSAVQVDGGSEFMAEFEQEAEKRTIRLFILPPKSPKLNGMVERMQRTSKEEVYDIQPIPLAIAEHNQLLIREDYVYNHIRPHDALNLLTPDEYYAANYSTS